MRDRINYIYIVVNIFANKYVTCAIYITFESTDASFSLYLHDSNLCHKNYFSVIPTSCTLITDTSLLFIHCAFVKDPKVNNDQCMGESQRFVTCLELTKIK